MDGSYRLRIPSDGRYTVGVKMAAFAAGTQEVVLDATHQDVQANFELVLSSRPRAGRPMSAAGECAAGAAFRVFRCFRVEAGRMRPVVP